MLITNKSVLKSHWCVLCAALLLCLPNVAAACSCALPPLSKTEKQLIKLERKKSQAVFSGEVTEIIIPKLPSGEESWTAEVRFKVLQTWKGTKSATVTVFTANVCCICGYKFEVGEQYLVYARGSKKDSLSTDTCTRTQKLVTANQDLRILGNSK